MRHRCSAVAAVLVATSGCSLLNDWNAIRPAVVDGGPTGEAGEPAWVLLLQETYPQVDVGRTDQVIVYSSLSGTASIGDMEVSTDSDSDVLLTELDTEGMPSFVKTYPGAGAHFAIAALTFPRGDIATTSAFFGQADLGAGPRQSLDDSTFSAAIAFYDSGGEHQWSYELNPECSMRKVDLIPPAAFGDQVMVLGHFTAPFELRQGETVVESFPHADTCGTAQTAFEDLFIVRFFSNGERRLAKFYSGKGSQKAQALVGNALGDIFVAATFSDTLSLDNGTQAPAPAPVDNDGDFDGLIARIDYQTEVELQYHLGGSGRVEGIALASTDSGEVYAAVGFDGELVIPGGPTLTSGGDVDIALIKLTRDLEYQWSEVYGGLGDDLARQIRVGPDQLIAVAGEFLGQLPIGTDSLTAEDRDGFVAVFDSEGSPLWALGFGGPGDDRAHSIRFDSAGYIYLAGGITQSANLGTGTLTATGDHAGVLAKLFAKTLPASSP